MRIAAIALFLAAFVDAADYPKALLKDPCAATHPCDAQIWLQLDADHPAFQATHDPRGAEHAAPVVSPDGKTIAYGVMELVAPERLSPLHIVFLDWSGHELRRIDSVPTDELGGTCGYGEIEWIDAAHIGVECEYNPSGGSYAMVNAVSGKVEKEFTGLYFSWSPDHQTLAHIGWIIHFASPASQNNCVLFNDRVVYTPGCSNEVEPAQKQAKKASHGVPYKPGVKSDAENRSDSACPEGSVHFENIHEISPPLVWSKDGRHLAFVEMIYDFDWDIDKNCEETYHVGNERRFVAVISTEHSAVGYTLTEPFEGPQWLDDSHLKVKDSRNQSVERIFDLAADPPKPIP